MIVSLLQWKLCRQGYHWPPLAVASVGPLILMQTSMQQSYIRAMCVACVTTAGVSSQQWSGTPWQPWVAHCMGGVLYVSKVPVTAGESHVVSGLT